MRSAPRSPSASTTDPGPAGGAHAVTSLRVPDLTPPGWREQLRLRWSAGLLRRLLQHFPGNTAMRADLADVLWLLGRHVEAVGEYDHVLRHDARQPHALLRAGVSLMQMGQHGGALTRFSEAVKLAPNDPETHFRKATALGKLRRWDEATRALQRALQLDPHDPRLHNQLGTVLLDQTQLDAALISFDRALALAPRMAQAISNRGLVMLRRQRFAEAEVLAREALAIAPELAAAHANLGLSLMWQHRFDEAHAALQQAQKHSPDPLVAWNLAYLHLLRGDWATGWRLLEARWDSVMAGAMPVANCPLWDGRSPLAGKTLLVHPEQGLGDVVQFCRFVPELVQRGARVVLHVPRELLRLLQCLASAQVTVLAQDQPVPPCDLRIPIMSLAGACGAVPGRVPGAAGYLRVPDALQTQWAQRLGPRTGPRIGLVWSGGTRPNQPELDLINQRRNIPLQALARLHRPGISWYSLQKGQAAEAEWQAVRRGGWQGPPLIDHMAEARDFADTAALIMQLDLVVAVDTSTAHVAAALGKPVWVLNRYDSCWRWQHAGSSTPWYDSLRLFRPRSPDEPRERLVAEVADALDTWLAAQPARRPEVAIPAPG